MTMAKQKERNNNLRLLLQAHALFAKKNIEKVKKPTIVVNTTAPMQVTPLEEETVQDVVNYDIPEVKMRYYQLVPDATVRPHIERILYLEFKKHPTEKEEYELSLLLNAGTRPHAARMMELKYKADRDPQEEQELRMLEIPSERAVAKRFSELMFNRPHTKREAFEYELCTYHHLRTYIDRGLLLHFDKTDLSKQEKREVKMFNQYLGSYVQHVTALEYKDELAEDEQSFLASAYLKRICHIKTKSIEQLEPYLRQSQVYPLYDCGKSDGNMATSPDREMARFLGATHAITNAARLLAETNMTYLMQSTLNQLQYNHPVTASAILDNKATRDRFNDPKKQAMPAEKIAVQSRYFALVLLKHFYDLAPVNFDCNTPNEFNENRLNDVVNKVRDAIRDRKIIFDNFNTRALQETKHKMKDVINPPPVENESNSVNNHRSSYTL